MRYLLLMTGLMLLPTWAAAQDGYSSYSSPSTFNPYTANQISPSAGGTYGAANLSSTIYNQNSVANPYDRQGAGSPANLNSLYGMYGNRYEPQTPHNVYGQDIQEKGE